MAKQRTNTPTIVVKSAAKGIRLAIHAGNGEMLVHSQALDSIDSVVNNLEALIFALKNGNMKYSKRGITDEQRAMFESVLSSIKSAE
jgi:hypothetical protein